MHIWIKEKIKIIITAGKKIQEENKAESLSIVSRRRTATQAIKKYRNDIKAKRNGLEKNEKSKAYSKKKIKRSALPPDPPQKKHKHYNFVNNYA